MLRVHFTHELERDKGRDHLNQSWHSECTKERRNFSFLQNVAEASTFVWQIFKEDTRNKANLMRCHNFMLFVLRFGYMSNVTCGMFNDHEELEHLTI